ncbi:MAG: hypothetical protein ACFKPT_21285 [Gloeotrichia echinulata GP01]
MKLFLEHFACYGKLFNGIGEWPQQWAIVQNSLGASDNNRLRGERAENLEQAIANTKEANCSQDSFLQMGHPRTAS